MSVDGLVDHLFRHAAGRMVAALSRSLGAAHLDVAEEAVQDALVRALELWSYRGVPADPESWLFRVARNRALDLLRRDATLARKMEQLALDGDVHDMMRARGDDELAMLLMCCHPILSREAQITLTLKTVGGFSVNEIAAAFLSESAAISQRLVRAKRLLSDRAAIIELPDADGVRERLPAVLDVLYLMFNEGYAAHAGQQLVRHELCGEAVRLARLLCSSPVTAAPSAFALLALLLLQSSRLAARTDDTGDLLLLDDQDRSSWDQRLIAEGMRALDASAHGPDVTRFHVQAAIAAAHAGASSSGTTDWDRILSLYDDLMSIAPSSVVAVNRAVALARVRGADAAIAELDRLRDDAALRRYFPYAAVMGGLWLELGRTDEAEEWYDRALPLAGNPAERRFVERRLEECRRSGRSGLRAL